MHLFVRMISPIGIMIICRFTEVYIFDYFLCNYHKSVEMVVKTYERMLDASRKNS